MKRHAGFATGLTLLALLTGVAAVVEWMHRSLPLLDGKAALTCLDRAATLERDRDGVPTVHAAGRADLSCVLGFLHGQDRFFQMDLMRRRAAGLLSELVGPAALDADRDMRIHRFSAQADSGFARLSEADREQLQRYTDGINAGLAALDAWPPEYALLRSEPAPWRPEDSLLVAYAMYALLHEPLGRIDIARGQLHATFPPALAEFLDPRATPWDAPIDGHALPSAEIPGPDLFDLRKIESLRQPAAASEDAALRGARPEEFTINGSNNMAVAGRHTRDGRGILANDTHLPLSMPNTWYRVVARVKTERTPTGIRLAGITLPGVPAFVAGSNDAVAWGVTNAQGDFADVLTLELAPGGESSYRTPEGGFEPFAVHVDEIPVLGREPVRFEYRWTRWGPAISENQALAWIAHERNSVNLELLELERAQSAEEALRIAARCRLPPQNFLAADAQGNIGWTLIGPIPRRRADGRLPLRAAETGAPWDGVLPPEDYPRLLNPPGGLLWTANNRVISGPGLEQIGDGGFDLGARAGRLRDVMLAAPRPLDEPALLAVQLDDRAPLIAGWYDRLQSRLQGLSAMGPAQTTALEAVRSTWDRRAAVDSAAYRIARAFRYYTAERVFEPFDRVLPGRDEGYRVQTATNQWEGPLQALIDSRPAHLLNPRFESWDALLDDAALAALKLVERDGTVSIDHARWGARNRVRIRHPLAQAVPALSRWFDAPVRELPGDGNIPRVQSPTFGASQRLVVAPGAPERGLFHMPGGTSGHFLSRFYLAGHDDWSEGARSPLLARETLHRLQLVPASWEADE